MKLLLSVLSLVMLPMAVLAQPTVVQIGSELVRGDSLTVFSARWSQYTLEDGKRQKKAEYFEQLIAEEAGWRHVQQVTQVSGGESSNITHFDKRSLRPLKITQTVDAGAGLGKVVKNYRFNGSQYQVDTSEPGKQVATTTGQMPVPMFNVANLGLVFASIELKQGLKLRLPSAFVQYHDAQFWTDAEVVGIRIFIDSEGNSHEAWEVNVAWLNIKDGDGYPPGASESGGAYYIAKDATAMGAPVAAYVNKSMAIYLHGMRLQEQ